MTDQTVQDNKNEVKKPAETNDETKKIDTANDTSNKPEQKDAK